MIFFNCVNIQNLLSGGFFIIFLHIDMVADTPLRSFPTGDLKEKEIRDGRDPFKDIKEL